MALDIKSKQVSADEFKLYTGIDLAYELQDDMNISNKVEAFLFREQTRFEAYLNAELFLQIGDAYLKLSDFQKEQYKYAVLEQLLYVFKNGNLFEDSGYNIDRGVVASNTELQMKYLSPMAKRFLINAGIWTNNLQGRMKYGSRFIF